MAVSIKLLLGRVTALPTLIELFNPSCNGIIELSGDGIVSFRQSGPFASSSLAHLVKCLEFVSLNRSIIIDDLE